MHWFLHYQSWKPYFHARKPVGNMLCPRNDQSSPIGLLRYWNDFTKLMNDDSKETKQCNVSVIWHPKVTTNLCNSLCLSLLKVKTWKLKWHLNYSDSPFVHFKHEMHSHNAKRLFWTASETQRLGVQFKVSLTFQTSSMMTVCENSVLFYGCYVL